MISVVYFESDGRNIMVGAFLMMSDAELFIKNIMFTEGYKIVDVEGWDSWSNIRSMIPAEEQ